MIRCESRVRSILAIGLLCAVFGLWPQALFATPSTNAKDDPVYTVRRGETLAEVAAKLGTNLATLRLLNHLGEGELVWAGQKLRTPPENGMVAYVVQSGDTLPRLAGRFGVPLAKLVEQNRLAPSQRLTPGQLLWAPVHGENPLAAELPTHIVAANESLAAIAERYDTSLQTLARVNGLSAPYNLRPGQKLLISPMSLHERLAKSPVGADGYHYHELKDFPTFTEKWIDVDLSEQRVVAYEGMRPVKSFIISSGRANTPTVTGVFRIWAKVPLQRMSGGNRAAGTYYDLPNVPWVQYFFADYSFHGTYWHNNFGRPMSHGCVNMRNADAKWLYEWASPFHNGGGWLITSEQEELGTLVIVHQ